jgi:hypothetical protein
MRRRRITLLVVLAAAVLLAVVGVRLASKSPDGLERVMLDLRIPAGAAPAAEPTTSAFAYLMGCAVALTASLAAGGLLAWRRGRTAAAPAAAARAERTTGAPGDDRAVVERREV